MKKLPELDPGYIAQNEIRQRGRAVRPVDSATLILVRQDDAHPKILMGKRSASHAFMPNKYVFPGGKVDRADSRLMPPCDLHPAVLSRLAKGCSETRARALAMAAIRETWEETGLLIGEGETPTLKSRSPQWQGFLRHNINPRLDSLHYIARAITPPYRSRRFDARFFMASAGDIHNDGQPVHSGSGELLELHWVTLADAHQLELPHITRLVLGEVERRLASGSDVEEPGPFIYFRNGKPVRDHH